MALSAALNPFHYGSPAVGEYFVDREGELADIVDRLLNGQNVILLSPRRYGKTSLLKAAIREAETAGGHVGYTSFAQCSSARDVANALLHGVLHGPLTRLARRQEQLHSLLGRLRPSIKMSLDANSRPEWSFGTSLADQEWRPVIQDVLRLLSHASEGRHPVALVMDEFQRVAEIDAALPGLFKELADELVRTSLVFSGSKLHVMRRVAIGAGAPLLDMGERISLRIVPQQAMCDFLVQRSALFGRPISRAASARAFDLVRGIPNDVQRLAYEAFFMAHDRIELAVVEAALDRVVDHRSADYEDAFSVLSPSQQRVLRQLALSTVDRPYSRRFLDAVEVANSNAVRTALMVLEERELVVQLGRTWTVADAFFERWLAGGGN